MPGSDGQKMTKELRWEQRPFRYIVDVMFVWAWRRKLGVCRVCVRHTVFSNPVGSIALGGVGDGSFPIAFPMYPHLQPRGGTGYQIWRWFELTVQVTLHTTGPYSALCQLYGDKNVRTPFPRLCLTTHYISFVSTPPVFVVLSDGSLFPHMKVPPDSVISARFSRC